MEFLLISLFLLLSPFCSLFLFSLLFFSFSPAPPILLLSFRMPLRFSSLIPHPLYRATSTIFRLILWFKSFTIFFSLISTAFSCLRDFLLFSGLQFFPNYAKQQN